MADYEDFSEIADPLERIQAVHGRIEEQLASINHLSELRRTLLRERLDGGMSQRDLASALNLSPSRMSQLVNVGVRPERALLGAGPLTIAVGGKRNAGRPDRHREDVTSINASRAYRRLAALADELGLAVTREEVPPPGHINLNRPDLVVLTSPRLLPAVGLMIDGDPHYGFGHDDAGWYLVDRVLGVEYRSPIDRGETIDYAYIGRLRRPDGRGTFLSVGGIHGPGTEGAAHFLAERYAELYRDVKGRPWSVLVSCRFDPDTQEILSSEPLTPVRPIPKGA